MRYQRVSSGFYRNLRWEPIERIIIVGYNFSLKSKSYDSLITRGCECCVLEIPRFHNSEIFAYTPLLDKDIIFKIMDKSAILSAKFLYCREVTIPVI